MGGGTLRGAATSYSDRRDSAHQRGAVSGDRSTAVSARKEGTQNCEFAAKVYTTALRVSPVQLPN